MRRLFACLLIMIMTQGASAQQKTGIALSVCDLDTARSVAIASDIMDKAEQAGFTVEMRSAGHRLSVQISDIYQMIEDHPQYLVVVAVKAVGLQQAIRAAAEQGIKVILVDRLSTDARPQDVLCAIGVDCEWAGGECARILAAHFEGRDANILEIQGEAGASTTNGYAKGFRDALCDYPNLQIAGVVPGEFSREAAQQSLLTFYKRNGTVFDAVFGHSDEEGLGAVGALLSLEGEEDIPVVCVGGADDAKRALAAGKLLACMDVTPYFADAVLSAIGADAVLSAIGADAVGQPVQALQLVRGEAAFGLGAAYLRGY